MKTFTSGLALLALLLGHAASAATIVITVSDNKYTPQTVTIHPGDIVTWQYATGASNTHPTASDNSVWTTFTINSANTTHSETFATAGAFPYHCNFHGGPGVGMYGVITVAAALAAQPAQLAAAAFSVYPNPADGSIVTLRLDRAQAHAQSLQVQVYSAMGALVRSLAVRPEEAGQELAVDVADLPAGLYCYRLLANSRVVATQRLTLIH